MYKKQLTPEQALQKLKQYCAYQERAHSDVSGKLYDLGVWRKDHDAIIASLIEEDYLNEQRFAIAFAGGKFRIKEWGRVKIKHELQQKKLSPYCINKAMKEIDEEAYLKTLNKLASKKYLSLKSDQHLVRKKKTFDYLLGRGFEPQLINTALEEIIAKKRTP